LDIALHFLLDQVEDILICTQACTIVMADVRTTLPANWMSLGRGANNGMEGQSIYSQEHPSGIPYYTSRLLDFLSLPASERNVYHKVLLPA